MGLAKHKYELLPTATVPASGRYVFPPESKDTKRLIKITSLLILVVQNSTLVLLLRYSRVVRKPGELMYSPALAVLLMELIKFACCMVALMVEAQSLSEAVRTFRSSIIRADTLKMAIPSGIYAIQNNLLYTALSNLDAATFQVTYQIKLLTTAVFAVILLGKQLTRVKWLSLIVLLIGVVLVQLCTEVNTGPNQASAASTHHQRYWIGMIALLTSAVSSGFAGCYFEGMMKQSHTSLWMRNMQLGAFAIPFSLMALLATDFGVILNGNPLNGFNTVTWCVVLNQALGGLLVSIVVKYADSVLKGFATSISIVLSSAISAVLFEFTPSGQFLVGTMLVIGSVVLYSM